MISESFTSVFTPASYTYQLVPEVQINNKTFITFMVKAAADAHVALSAVYGDVDRKTYEIVIGTDGNTKSIIRYGAGGPIMVESMTMNVLSEEEFRYFGSTGRTIRSKWDVVLITEWVLSSNGRFHPVSSST